MTRKLIHVLPRLEVLPARVQSALTHLLPISFACGDSAPSGQKPAGAIGVGLSGDEVGRWSNSGIPMLVLPPSVPRVQMHADRHCTIQFARGAHLDPRLRGQSLSHRDFKPAETSNSGAEAEVLALCNGSPVWTEMRRGSAVQVVAAPLPDVGEQWVLGDSFNPDDFFPLLALIHFLRGVIGQDDWNPPALRACLMFDDPNLHWPTYGYVDYAELAGRAERDNFHVAFATVPLDSWLVNRRTAALFRSRSSRLSLLIHGNNHLRAELGRIPNRHGEHLKIAAQSVRRIDRLDAQSGLKTARVIAPPHGACAEELMPHLARVGIRGACISSGSLRSWNREKKWTENFGAEPAEIMAGGFPVIPRFRMSAGCNNAIVLSAFLDRPIIPVGHHDTIADGPELLSRVAAMVNALPNVQWCSPETMFQQNFKTLRRAQLLRVKPFSLDFSVVIPPDIHELELELPPGFPVGAAYGSTASNKLDGGRKPLLWRNGTVLPVSSGDIVQFRCSKLGSMDPYAVSSPRRSLWAFPRRLLCEARDRVLPWTRKRAASPLTPVTKTEAA